MKASSAIRLLDCIERRLSFGIRPVMGGNRAVSLRRTTDNPPVPESDRLRALLDAGIALASELSLDAVLQKIVEAATELTGAQYAALGVIDPSGQILERFVVAGIDEETQAAIGDPPRGGGILGVLIHERSE